MPLSSFRKYVVPRFHRILLPRNENLKIPEVTSRKLETVSILLWGDHVETRSHAYLSGSQWSEYSEGTVRVQLGYSEGTVRVQWGYSEGTVGVQ